jgi:MFS family permease
MVLKSLFKELGLNSVARSSVDAKLLILTRFMRFFAFGGSTIVLALYLHSLHIPDVKIGLFFSLTLIGDILSFGLTLRAAGIGRRMVLGGGALLMCMSGIVFGCSQDWRWLLAASIIGVISPK